MIKPKTLNREKVGSFCFAHLQNFDLCIQQFHIRAQYDIVISKGDKVE